MKQIWTARKSCFSLSRTGFRSGEQPLPIERECSHLFNALAFQNQHFIHPIQQSSMQIHLSHVSYLCWTARNHSWILLRRWPSIALVSLCILSDLRCQETLSNSRIICSRRPWPLASSRLIANTWSNGSWALANQRYDGIQPLHPNLLLKMNIKTGRKE